jgi:hypothetical protein
MDCIIRNPQMQLHEAADNIANVIGSAFGRRRYAELYIGLE